ncbi:MAG: M48 family metallopeptidase [Deltaproteobacteria bacterium]|nr:M48 family metallopeptidase [Deltaproteobacteria bacterium]
MRVEVPLGLKRAYGGAVPRREAAAQEERTRREGAAPHGRSAKLFLPQKGGHVNIEQLRTEKERTRFKVAAVISGLIWFGLVVGTLGIGLIWIGFGAVFYLVINALFLASVKGNGVKITADQFPELHAKIVEASRKLGLESPPEAWFVNNRGVFNAFATRYLGRNFIVFFAELLECCDENDGSIDFIVGHEISHLAFGHLKWASFLIPARAVPLLGAAYSRACEYSCDQAGAYVAGRPEAAVAGLSVLAAGGRYSKKLDVERFIDQRHETGGYWLAVFELGLSHPYLSKRVAAVLNRGQPEVERNPLAYVTAPFLGFAGGAAGGMAGMMFVVAMIGVLSAIAIPNFIKYQQRAEAQRLERAVDPSRMGGALEDESEREPAELDE